jgi:DNA-binding PadR family transcriptional regulator
MNEEGAAAAASAEEPVETGSVTSEEVLAITGHAPAAEDKGDDNGSENSGDDDKGDADSSSDVGSGDADEAKPDNAETAQKPAEAPKEQESKVDAPAAAEVAPETPTFAVEVEDANGNKVVINPGDDIEKVLESFEPKSNGQIFKILQDVQKAELAKTEYDKQQEESAATAERQEQVDKLAAHWDSEIAQLQGQKRLPVDAAGKSEDRVNEVFKFMAEENDRRTQAGRTDFLMSFEDGLDKLELREQATRKKGGMVGGSSAPATSGGPVYKGGARNANQALSSMGIL